MMVVCARLNVAADQIVKAMPPSMSASPATVRAAPPGIVHGRQRCSAHNSANGPKKTTGGSSRI
jgi:hypothetical protein